jgi:uncharacterized membrane protein YphA (DoxX/SURF4 family)
MGIMSKVGEICLATIFIMSGVHKLQEPAAVAGMIQKGGFPIFLKMIGLQGFFTDAVAVPFVQVLGLLFIIFGLGVVLNIKKGCAALGLAALLVPVAVFTFIDWKNPAKLSEANMISLMKDTAIVGGLLITAANACATCAPSKPAVTAEKKNK